MAWILGTCRKCGSDRLEKRWEKHKRYFYCRDCHHMMVFEDTTPKKSPYKQGKLPGVPRGKGQ